MAQGFNFILMVARNGNIQNLADMLVEEANAALMYPLTKGELFDFVSKKIINGLNTTVFDGSNLVDIINILSNTVYESKDLTELIDSVVLPFFQRILDQINAQIVSHKIAEFNNRNK